MTEILLTSGSSWTVPSDCVSAEVECVGGGQGGNATNGGNGGDYARVNSIALTPGDSIAIAIGSGGTGVSSGSQNAGGDTSFGSSVLAKGGGSASTDVGDTTYAGGTGDASGAGGGAAGASGAGNNASGTTPGAGDGDLAGAGGDPGSGGSPPVLVHQAATGNTSAATSLSLTFGFTPTAGNTLLIAVREYVTGDATTPSGWTLVTEQLPSGSTRPCIWYSKTSDGTETGVTVSFSNNQGHGIAVQEWQGSVTFSTANGAYIASGITNPQACGPSSAPPSATAVPSTYAWWNNIGTNQVTWPAGWTGTSTSLSNAHNSCEIGTMATAPNAAVTPNLSFTTAPGSYMYWWNIWVDNA